MVLWSMVYVQTPWFYGLWSMDKTPWSYGLWSVDKTYGSMVNGLWTKPHGSMVYDGLWRQKRIDSNRVNPFQ